MDELSRTDNQSRSNNIENENLGNRRKKRRVTYSYEDPELDDEFDFGGSEDGDETWNPSETDVDEIDSYILLNDEPAEDIENKHSNHDQSSGEYSCDGIIYHSFRL